MVGLGGRGPSCFGQTDSEIYIINHSCARQPPACATTTSAARRAKALALPYRSLSRRRRAILERAKRAVAGVAEPRDDVALLIHFGVDARAVDAQACLVEVVQCDSVSLVAALCRVGAAGGGRGRVDQERGGGNPATAAASSPKQSSGQPPEADSK